MLGHEAAERGAVFPEVAFLQDAGGNRIDTEIFGDELPDTAIDLIEQPARGRIKGVVEVEYPDSDVIERKGPGNHALKVAVPRRLGKIDDRPAQSGHAVQGRTT